MYTNEWRLEQLDFQTRYSSELKWEVSRTTMSEQISKTLQSEKLPETEIEDIIANYVDVQYPNSVTSPSDFSVTTFWTYPTSVWYVVCQIMSLEPIRKQKVFSVVTHLFSLYNKLIGPTAAILAIASMTTTINWLFTVLLSFVLLPEPKDLAECLTAAYQKNLLIRDLLVMALSLCYGIGAIALCVYLHSTHNNVDMLQALAQIFAMMSLTTVTGSQIYAHNTKNSIMEALYWVCLLFLVNSALATVLAAIIRSYKTWINSEDVVATPKELILKLERERQEKRNQLVYHAKSE
ncbi:hypothetical protein RB195_021207 [Necator americanus]